MFDSKEAAFVKDCESSFNLCSILRVAGCALAISVNAGEQQNAAVRCCPTYPYNTHTFCRTYLKHCACALLLRTKLLSRQSWILSTAFVRIQIVRYYIDCEVLLVSPLYVGNTDRRDALLTA